MAVSNVAGYLKSNQILLFNVSVTKENVSPRLILLT